MTRGQVRRISGVVIFSLAKEHVDDVRTFTVDVVLDPFETRTHLEKVPEGDVRPFVVPPFGNRRRRIDVDQAVTHQESDERLGHALGHRPRDVCHIGPTGGFVAGPETRKHFPCPAPRNDRVRLAMGPGGRHAAMKRVDDGSDFLIVPMGTATVVRTSVLPHGQHRIPPDARSADSRDDHRNRARDGRQGSSQTFRQRWTRCRAGARIRHRSRGSSSRNRAVDARLRSKGRHRSASHLRIHRRHGARPRHASDRS